MARIPAVAYDRHQRFDLCTGDGTGERDDIHCGRRIYTSQWYRQDEPVKLRRYKRCAECTAEIVQRRAA